MDYQTEKHMMISLVAVTVSSLEKETEKNVKHEK